MRHRRDLRRALLFSAAALFAAALVARPAWAVCPPVDPCHSAPFLNPATGLCEDGPFTGCTLTAVRDSMLLISDRNTNEGGNTSLWLQEQGPRRIVLRFPLGACSNDATRTCAAASDCAPPGACNPIDGAGVLGATLRMSIRTADSSWAVGEPVAAYPIGGDFSEGDGKTFDVPVDEVETRGTGPGVTYNCGTDTNIANTAADCSPQWNAGNTSIGAASDTFGFQPSLTGNVTWDVTADVAAGGNRWLVKKATETNAGRVAFHSREGAAKAGNADLAPRLVMTGGSYCSDGTLDPGEDCDDGNRVDGDCCSWDCRFEAAATVCRSSLGICDTAESCTGASGTCPPDVVAPAGTSCRASTGECDPAESCTGASGACPVDAKSPAGTACTSDGNPCTADQCDGTSATCQHPAGNAGAVCRSKSGACDVADSCTGASTSCPPDGVATSGTVCRAPAGLCDLAEACNGTTKTCPADLLSPAGAVCRASASVCDVAETCSGTSSSCPSDVFAPAGVVCRPEADECDVAETCNGASGTCPADAGEPDTDADGLCDVIDPCTNVGGLQDFALKSKLVLSRIAADTTVGNDKVSLSGTFALPPTVAFSSLDPRARGARFLLLDEDARVLVDAVLPGGSYGGRGTRGWKTNSRGTVWQYLDRTASRVEGVSDLKANDRSRGAPGGAIKVSTRGSKGTYPVVAGDEPVEAILVLGDQVDATAGRCGETAYVAGSCKFNGTSTTLTCKR